MKARVKYGDERPGNTRTILHHRMLHPRYDPEKVTGVPGPKANSGDVISVTSKELASFPDKLEVVSDDTPLTYSEADLKALAIGEGLDHDGDTLKVKEDEPSPGENDRTPTKPAKAKS